jgi:predicted O-methyltransferase YrrM
MLDPRRDGQLRPSELIARLGLRSDAVVADIGAGPGYFTLPLAATVPDGRVIATDVEPRFLELAVARARARGLRNIVVQPAPRDRPGLEAGSIDLAFLCQVDQSLGDRAAYLRALVPSLRPGGRIALVNTVAHRAADLAAADAAALRVVDEWQPSPSFFLLLLTPRREAP